MKKSSSLQYLFWFVLIVLAICCLPALVEVLGIVLAVILDIAVGLIFAYIAYCIVAGCVTATCEAFSNTGDEPTWTYA